MIAHTVVVAEQSPVRKAWSEGSGTFVVVGTSAAVGTSVVVGTSAGCWLGTD